MYGNEVHTLEDEAAWERAKVLAATEYPGATGSNYWQVVRDIYAGIAAAVAKSSRGDHDPLWRMAR